MQIRVNGTPGVPIPNWYDLAALATLKAVWAKGTGTSTKRGVFEASQDPIIMPDARYNSAYNKNFPADTYFRINDNTNKTFKTVSGALVTKPIQPKAIQDEMGEAYDTEYGRMSAMLGLELPSTGAGAQNFMLYGYGSPPVDIIMDSMVPSEPAFGDGTQIWRITHNGVDTHTIHFHEFNVQLINRVAWDNAIRVPDPEELGWKETIRVNPLQDTIVAMRPVLPNSPFDLPNSVRLIDVTMPPGDILPGGPGGFFDIKGEPVIVVNHEVNFGHEYVYHCHLLAHEEMDMMHSLIFAVAPKPPTNLVAALKGNSIILTWNDISLNATGFTLQRANTVDFTTGFRAWTLGKITTFTDNTINKNNTYYYRVQAINVVGDTTVYPAPAVGFPTMTAKSLYSNIAPYPSTAPLTTPNAPSNLLLTTARVGNNARVTLNWTQNSNDEGGFTIQRANNPAFNFPTTSSVAANITTFTTGNLPLGTLFYFRVRAFNAAGVSAWITDSITTAA
jgi:hypothetical protein